MHSTSLRIALLLGVAAGGLQLAHMAIAQSVPTDAVGGCPITPAKVASFFESGSPSLNGVVKPADSTVILTPNCGFFTWSEQMFLWLVSPAPATYGGGGRIMFSPQFFTVTPPDSAGRRSFIRNRPGFPIRMSLRATELGPHGLPVLLARTGQVVEVQRTLPGARIQPVIRLPNGQMTRIGNVKQGPQGKLNFFDVRGKQVQPRALQLPMVRRPLVQIEANRRVPLVPVRAVTEAIQVRKFVINKIPIFIDFSGHVIDVEPGQADGGVLISQGGKLIYYIIAVNDVFAYHRTMQGPALIPFNTPLTFPLTMAQANAVKAFAATKGHTILDPEALAIETKSSWVEASSVPDPGNYVTVTAEVPTFDKSNPNNWTMNGQTSLKLVMVGLHVVGSTNGHGEMVWGSFEHLGNAPNDVYAYNSTTGVKTIPRNTSGSWLFTPSGSAGPFNVAAASWTGSAITGSPIGPSSVLRAKPWGSNDGGNPASIAGINTQVISSNASVLSQLDPNDVRSKYFQLGTTWTIGGAAPSGGNEVGTNHLANATMETFVQGSNSHDASANCFACHTTNKVSVSHIYRELTPLP